MVRNPIEEAMCLKLDRSQMPIVSQIKCCATENTFLLPQPKELIIENLSS